MCDLGDNLERVQLIFAEVSSLGSLPQFNHTGLPELCIRIKHRGEKKRNDNRFEDSQEPLQCSHAQKEERFEELQ